MPSRIERMVSVSLWLVLICLSFFLCFSLSFYFPCSYLLRLFIVAFFFKSFFLSCFLFLVFFFNSLFQEGCNKKKSMAAAEIIKEPSIK